MQGWHDAARVILQILSNPAWSGVSSLCSLIGIPLAILLARKTNIPSIYPLSYITSNKKKSKKSSKMPIFYSLMLI